jgi:hypothetical protein
MKIQELFFINGSLNMKLNEIEDLEKKESDNIMNKFTVFEASIEKYEQENAELEEQNRLLQMQLCELG